REAAQFLAGLADRRPAMRTPLLQASKAYREEALALSRLTSLFPYPHGGDIGNPRAREQGARYLASAYMNEGEAISSLREALGSA
ncbi:MAG TPA: hypothetical protein VNL92_04315, partial [Dehalococcoidia bacterium]|nr:hypothetical protein [Dehalococcoidia bacterium]